LSKDSKLELIFNTIKNNHDSISQQIPNFKKEVNQEIIQVSKDMKKEITEQSIQFSKDIKQEINEQTIQISKDMKKEVKVSVNYFFIIFFEYSPLSLLQKAKYNKPFSFFASLLNSISIKEK
jgi:hypothetical protein